MKTVKFNYYKKLNISNFLGDLMRGFLVVMLVLIMAISAMAIEYKNPLNMNIQYDDVLPNATFDIKSDKQTYNGLAKEIVYFSVTNLTNNIEQIDLSVFFNTENVTITWFGQWKNLSREIPIFTTTDINNIIQISDINNFISCTDSGYFDIDINTCREETQETNLTGTTTENYDGWKKSKAQQWQEPNPILVPENFNPKGSLTNMTIGKNETKYFVIEFSHSPGTSGEFYICADTDCLDPFFDNDWKFKQEITIESPGSATGYQNLLDLNSTTIGQHFLDNVNDDFSDVRILDNTETIEQNYWIVTGSITPDINGHVWFAGDLSSGDNKFFVYYGNPGVLTTSDFNTTFDLFDDFSDGDFTSSPTWNIASGGWEVTASLRLEENNISGNAIDSVFSTSKEIIGDSALSSTNFNFTTNSSYFPWITTSEATCEGGATESVQFFGNGILAVTGEGTILSTQSLINSQDREVVVYKDKADRFYVVIDDTTFFGASISATALVTANYEKVCLQANSGVSADSSYDNFFFSQSTLDDVNVVYTGIPLANADVNIIFPNGGESFNKTIITNVDINFTVQHGDSNSLLVDLNFSTSSTQGTGEQIINDINTDSGSIICDDSDFSNNTQCSFSWDISAVADNNYFILITISAFSIDTFDASDATFEIFTFVPAPPIPPIISNLCEIETTAGAINKIFLQEGLHRKPYTFIATIEDTSGIAEGLNPKISFRNSDLDIIIFQDESMIENFSGEYVFTKEMSLEDGIYSYFVDVDLNCFRAFFLEVKGEPKIISSNTQSPPAEIINSSFDVNFFILLSITIIISIGIAGVLFVKSIRDRILNIFRGN